jgi:hypothetical protein
VEKDVGGYPMEAILMQVVEWACHHFEMFHCRVLNYPMYDKELYALVQAVKK